MGRITHDRVYLGARVQELEQLSYLSVILFDQARIFGLDDYCFFPDKTVNDAVSEQFPDNIHPTRMKKARVIISTRVVRHWHGRRMIDAGLARRMAICAYAGAPIAGRRTGSLPAFSDQAEWLRE